MDIQAAHEFATKLRSLARRVDNGRDRQSILEELIYLAENYEEVAERIDMDNIIQMQRDYVEAN